MPYSSKYKIFVIFVITLSLRKYYLRKFSILGTRWVWCQMHELLKFFKPFYSPQPSSLTQRTIHMDSGCDFLAKRKCTGCSESCSLSIVMTCVIACMLQTFLSTFLDVMLLLAAVYGANSSFKAFVAVHFTFIYNISDIPLYGHVVCRYVNFNKLLWNYEIIITKIYFRWKSDLFTKILYYENLELYGI